MPAKYREASAKASHDQPYVHMISYSITEKNIEEIYFASEILLILETYFELILINIRRLYSIR